MQPFVVGGFLLPGCAPGSRPFTTLSLLLPTCEGARLGLQPFCAEATLPRLCAATSERSCGVKKQQGLERKSSPRAVWSQEPRGKGLALGRGMHSTALPRGQSGEEECLRGREREWEPCLPPRLLVHDVLESSRRSPAPVTLPRPSSSHSRPVHAGSCKGDMPHSVLSLHRASAWVAA